MAIEIFSSEEDELLLLRVSDKGEVDPSRRGADEMFHNFDAFAFFGFNLGNDALNVILPETKYTNFSKCPRLTLNVKKISK